MLRTLAFLGVAAVAYKQLKGNGSLDSFKADLRRRADDLRAYAQDQRAAYRASAETGTPVAPAQPAGAAPAI